MPADTPSRRNLRPFRVRSRINQFAPSALTPAQIEADDRAITLAARRSHSEAGFDGVEIMGSEGYLINQFTVALHQRSHGRMGRHASRTVIACRSRSVARTRARHGPGFIIIYRLSAIDLVEGGATGEEIDRWRSAVEAAGADILNTGIGWHEARIPTIAYVVPRAALRFAPRR